MRDLLSFFRSGKSRSGDNYGRILPTYRWRGEPPPRPSARRSGIWSALRPWLLLIALAALWYGYDIETLQPFSVLASEPERVQGQFTRCSEERGNLCVVDGDTVKIGDRTVRIFGIDAPEIHPPRCAFEARQGEAAADALVQLVNSGPFDMTGRIDGMTDKYGRELRAFTRVRGDGTVQVIAEDLIASGYVRRYTGGTRQPWC